VTRAALRVCALCALLAAGCSRSPDQTAVAPSPSVADAVTSPSVSEFTPSPIPTQSTPEIRIADKHGIVNIGRGAVDPQSLHVPIYPGATQSSGIGSFSDSDANGSTAITTLDAQAPFDQVDAWYKSHLPADAQPTHITVGGESTASYEWTSADGSADRVVTINSNQGNPIITISVKISHNP
jgi:hypothetical protein